MSTWMRLDTAPANPHTAGGGKGGERELEEDIIRELCRRHDTWIAADETSRHKI